MDLARLEEHAVAGADHLDRSAAALAEAYALGDVDGLAVGVDVPRGSSSRGEVDAAGRQAGWLCKSFVFPHSQGLFHVWCEVPEGPIKRCLFE
jgi:hypothetical protein